MVLCRSQVWSSRCYSSFPDTSTLWMKHLSFSSKAGLKFELPSLKISKDGQNSFAPNYTKLFPTGSEFKRKGINVVTQNTSLSRKPDLLDAYEDEYDGAIIDAECLPTSGNAFAAILQSSISSWKEKGKKGIWLKILESQADLVPIAIKSGFTYHHAEPGYVMLTCWLPDEPCMLPFTATHQVGIGAFIINENKEVLVVKEKKCPLRCLGVWKLPTGFINKSEEIFSGAIREVKEETGIDTSFLEVLAFRHAHNVTFGKSDLFFVCMLKPLSFEITIDESEIEAAKWMPLDQLIDQPFHREDSMTKNMIDICIARHEDRYRGFNPLRIMSKFDDRLATLYYGDMEVIDDNGVIGDELMCSYHNAAFYI